MKMTDKPIIILYITYFIINVLNLTTFSAKKSNSKSYGRKWNCWKLENILVFVPKNVKSMSYDEVSNEIPWNPGAISAKIIGYRPNTLNIVYLASVSFNINLFDTVIVWIICAILTATVNLPEAAQALRTDLKMDAFNKAAWFRIPYPFQWGMPTFSVASVVGMLAGDSNRQ